MARPSRPARSPDCPSPPAASKPSPLQACARFPPGGVQRQPSRKAADVRPVDRLCRAVLCRHGDARAGAGAQDRPLCPHTGAAEDPHHARTHHVHRRGLAAGARGGAVRKPVQVQQVDLDLRLAVPRRPAAGAAAARALLPAAGVDGDRTGAALWHLRRLCDGGGPGRTVGAPLSGGPGALHLHAVGPPAPGLAAGDRADRAGHAFRQPTPTSWRSRPSCWA